MEKDAKISNLHLAHKNQYTRGASISLPWYLDGSRMFLTLGRTESASLYAIGISLLTTMTVASFCFSPQSANNHNTQTATTDNYSTNAIITLVIILLSASHHLEAENHSTNLRSHVCMI